MTERERCEIRETIEKVRKVLIGDATPLTPYGENILSLCSSAEDLLRQIQEYDFKLRALESGEMNYLREIEELERNYEKVRFDYSVAVEQVAMVAEGLRNKHQEHKQ